MTRKALSKEEIYRGGFFVIARKIIDSSLMAMRAEDFKLAICLMAEANYEESKYFDRWGKKEIVIKRGQLVTTIISLSEKSVQSYKVTRTALFHLIQSKFCVDLTPDAAKRAKGFWLLELPNYQYYQDIMNYLLPKREKDGKRTGKGREKDGKRTGKGREKDGKRGIIT